MQVGTWARADWPALIGAALVGSGAGLTLGATYLAGGAGADQHRPAMEIVAAQPGPVATAAPAAPEPVRAAAGVVASPPVAGLDPAPVGAPAPVRLIASSRPAPAVKPARMRELDCLAQAVYFEARGESPQGQAAVATVIMNRVKNPSFPKTVCDVVYQGAGRRGCQFSFACDGSVERVVEPNAYRRARKVAARALSGAVLADIGSATHFHTTAVAPQWGARMRRVAQVGLHVFYRFNPRVPARPASPAAAPVEPTAVLTSLPLPPAEESELRLASAVLGGSAADSAPPATAAPAAPPTAPVVKPVDAPRKADVQPGPMTAS